MSYFLSKQIVRDILFSASQQTGKWCFGLCNQNRQGLTLVEVMLVIVIIGILSSIAMPSYISSRQKAKLAATVSEIRILEKMIIGYRIDHACYPESLEDLGNKTPEDLWGNPYQYLKIEGRTKEDVGAMRKDRNMVPVNSDFDLYSKGQDGESVTPFKAEASRDDIVRANNGRYIGLVSDY
jgi:general secretion pathway protein G